MAGAHPREGWIAVSRRLLDPSHDLVDDGEPVCKAFAWIDLIGTAEWREDADLDRGCFQHTTEGLRRRWNWPSKSNVYRFLKALRRDDRIEKVSPGGPNRSAIYRIVNYDQYQFSPGEHPERGSERGLERGLERGNPRHDREKEGERNADRNAEQNAERNAHLLVNNREQEQKSLLGDAGNRFPHPDQLPKSGGRYTYPAEFEAFWTSYPDRRGSNSKLGAYRKWRSTVLDGVEPELLFQAAMKYREFCQADGKAGTSYVMQAKTFLGPDEHWRQAWDDQPESVSQADQTLRTKYEKRVRKARSMRD